MTYGSVTWSTTEKYENKISTSIRDKIRNPAINKQTGVTVTDIIVEIRQLSGDGLDVYLVEMTSTKTLTAKVGKKNERKAKGR